MIIYNNQKVEVVFLILQKYAGKQNQIKEQKQTCSSSTQIFESDLKFRDDMKLTLNALRSLSKRCYTDANHFLFLYLAKSNYYHLYSKAK